MKICNLNHFDPIHNQFQISKLCNIFSQLCNAYSF